MADQTLIFNLTDDGELLLVDEKLESLTPNKIAIDRPGEPCEEGISASFATDNQEEFEVENEKPDIQEKVAESVVLTAGCSKVQTVSEQEKLYAEVPLPDVTSPFKKTLPWPTKITTKKSRPKKSLPSVVTSDAWNEFYRKKEEDKLLQQQEKILRREERLKKLIAKKEETEKLKEIRRIKKEQREAEMQRKKIEREQKKAEKLQQKIQKEKPMVAKKIKEESLPKANENPNVTVSETAQRDVQFTPKKRKVEE